MYHFWQLLYALQKTDSENYSKLSTEAVLQQKRETELDKRIQGIFTQCNVSERMSESFFYTPENEIDEQSASHYTA